MGWIVTINKILSLIDIHTSAVVSLTWNNLSGTGGHNKQFAALYYHIDDQKMKHLMIQNSTSYNF